jgi:ribosomal protein S18 acetylase RimI-like enzyme
MAEVEPAREMLLPSSITYVSRVNVSVREFREGDWEQIAELWTEAYCGPGPGERATPYVLADVQEATAVGRLLVASEGEKVVGAVVFYPPGLGREIPGEGEAELSRLAVAALSRGRGIGRALAEGCLAAARATGAVAIVLWSRPHQHIAHRLYESFGFRRVPGRDSGDAEGPKLVFRLAVRPDG